eukprot:4492241-Amphidinium_carterae.4
MPSPSTKPRFEISSRRSCATSRICASHAIREFICPAWLPLTSLIQVQCTQKMVPETTESDCTAAI